jgi:SAM-dependent methyltransferase
VFGVDISEFCARNAGGECGELGTAVMDLGRLAIRSGSLDGIVSYYSVIHTPGECQEMLFSEFSRVLREGGKLLLAVKKGVTEGFLDELLGYNTRIYFTGFKEPTVRNLLTSHGFSVSFLETRSPYTAEIDVERIFALGVKE